MSALPLSSHSRHHLLRLGLAVAGALLAFNLLAFFFGQAPAAMLRAAWAGTWGTAYGAGQVMFKATPLLLTGLSFHVALRAGLFNIGSEGQLALGSLAGAWVGAQLSATTPALIALPAALLAALLVGAGYAAIAGWMRARLGVHEIISTIMLNRCADVVLPWLLVVVLGATQLRSADVVPGAKLTPLSHWLDALGGSAASTAFPLAVAITFGVYAWLARSRTGREMRWVGMSAPVCEARGIDVPKRRVQAMLLSGALAGCAVAGTVLGYKGYFELGLGAGAGFSGIAVAMVGRRNPLAMVLSALAFGTLAQAGLAINARVPKEAMGILEALVILLMAAAAYRRRGHAAAELDDDSSSERDDSTTAEDSGERDDSTTAEDSSGEDGAEEPA